jgi:hypothetical protein
MRRILEGEDRKREYRTDEQGISNDEVREESNRVECKTEMK